jgi:hypothetical protein
MLAMSKVARSALATSTMSEMVRIRGEIAEFRLDFNTITPLA